MALIRGDYGTAIVAGRLVKPAEQKKVKDYDITKLAVSTGKDAPVVTCTLWNDMALGYAGLKKNARVLVCGTLSARDFNGKVYYDMNVDYISVQDEIKLEPVADPFASLSTEAVPF